MTQKKIFLNIMNSCPKNKSVLVEDSSASKEKKASILPPGDWSFFTEDSDQEKNNDKNRNNINKLRRKSLGYKSKNKNV